MRITRFEDIESWKEARKLAKDVFEVTKSRAFFDDLSLRRQMRRCLTSAMANIAEGFDAGSDPEFGRFLKISRRSATEFQSHLYVALDRDYIDRETCDRLYRKAQTVRRLITGFMRYLKTGLGKKQAA